MKRRTAIKNLLFVVGGVMVIPSCLHHEEQAYIPLHHLKIDGEGEKLLAELVGTLIPTTHTPGAKDTYTHRHVLRMVDDCFDKDVQDQFTKGLKEVDRMAKDRFHTSFAQATPQQRGQIVADLEKRSKDKDDLSTFYSTVKKLTIQGYTNSKYVLTNVFHYELVPGRYNGAFPVKPSHFNV